MSQGPVPDSSSKRRPLRAANLLSLRDKSFFHLFMNFCLMILPLVVIGFFWGFYERTHHPPQRFYAVNNDKLTPMNPLNQPNLTTDAILRWAVQAATTCYTFDFYNYQEVFKNVRGYFTEPGFLSFQQALAKARVIESVVAKRLVVSAVPTDTPIILHEGKTSDGTYAWQVQFPMLITYLSASEQTRQNIVITLLIARVPTTQSVQGIGIASFMVREFTAARF